MHLTKPAVTIWRIYLLVFFLQSFLLHGIERTHFKNQFDKIIYQGDYAEAKRFLGSVSKNTNPLEFSYCQGRFFTDLGARNLAISCIENALGNYRERDSTTIFLVLENYIVLADAYYENNQEEKYRETIDKIGELVHNLPAHQQEYTALWHAMQSRYFAVNLESYRAQQEATPAIRLLFDERVEWNEVDKNRVFSLTLNGFRNFSKYYATDSFAQAIYQQRGALAKELYHKLKGQPENLATARQFLIVGNIFQDIGQKISKQVESIGSLATKEARILAIASYQQAIELAHQTVGKHSWLCSYANSLLALQYTYTSEYHLSAKYAEQAIRCSAHPSDTALLLNQAQLNIAVKFASWNAYKFQYISNSDTGFYNFLVPVFESSVKAFHQKQLENFLVSGHWLKDGYRQHPGQELYPFMEYFQNLITTQGRPWRQQMSFYEFAGTKLQLISWILGEENFKAEATKFLENRFRKQISAEITMLAYRNLLPANTSIPKREIQTINPKFLPYISGGFFPSTSEIAASLDSGEAYLEFWNVRSATGDAQKAVLVFQAGTYTTEVPALEIALRIDDRSEWPTDHFAAGCVFSRAYQELFAEIDSVLQHERITKLRIKPGFVMSGIPFEALLKPDGQPLARTLEISYTLCPGIDALLQELDFPGKGGFVSFQPEYEKNRLPHSKNLADRLGMVYGSNLSQKADLKALKNVLGNAEVVHIGAHGSASRMMDNLFDHGNKYFFDSTFIYLENSRIPLSAFENLRTNADLVVIAACESGAGVMEYGEGKIDFARLLIQAGAKGVVTGLWKLDDYATSKILGHFYANLEKGETCSRALQQAKLQFLKGESDPVYQNPTYWAGIIYIGSDQAVVLKRKSSSLAGWPFGLAILSGALIVGFFIRNRFSKS